MSRLNDLLRELRSRDPALARDLEQEVAALADRRAFGLNFERHVPEAVELPGRRVRKGDKVRVLPPRGQVPKEVDKRLWRVVGIDRAAGRATLEPLAVPEEGRARSEASTSVLEDLVVVAEFRDPIYPGLVSTGQVERGGEKPFHTVINAENYHALETLLFTHRGKVDAIYVDPPYNSGARDWKYNNDYVESDDLYRHSKWLAMMERRLLLAKELLNPKASALIVTIDEKEYLRLGLLLQQTFSDARIQMVSSQINAKGIVRDNEFSRTNEFLFYVAVGQHRITPELKGASTDKVRWASLRRSDVQSARGTKKGGPEQFYPIYVNNETGKIEEIGRPLKPDEDIHAVPARPGCSAVLPIRDKGDVKEMNWGLTIPSLKERLDKGFVKAVVSGKRKKKVTMYYLTSGPIAEIERGSIVIDGYDENGVAQVSFVEGKRSNPSTQWAKDSHNAQSHGSDMLKAMLGDRAFPFPKSLYAVEDVLRIAVGGTRDATVLDFFAGSGTTAHAVMRLNRQDDGRRQCILVTNNEVAADEQQTPAPDRDQRGICEYITKPRVAAAITGKTPNGDPIKGDYKFTDEFPMADGFEENVEFFTLTYEAPLRVASNREFTKIAPLLWIRAGAHGRRIDDISKGWDVADTYGVLANLDLAEDFLKAVGHSDDVAIAYVVTDEDRLFESVAQELPDHVEPVRLYEAYLRNFEIESGRGVL